MQPWNPTLLGRTNLSVGRLGLASGYGADDRCVSMAFDGGVNYFYWGSFRRPRFGAGLRGLPRERIVLTIQSYSRVARLVPWSVERALRALQMEYADCLLLGLWNRPVSPTILDAARGLRERGLVRHLALSTHSRPLASTLAKDGEFDVLHVRYNAIHRGAERDIFPHLPPRESRPGMVAFTATSWRQLLTKSKLPVGERIPSAADCYRFVLSHPAIDVCMAGPKNALQLKAALEGLARGPMEMEECAWMARVGDAKYGR
jgi:aryl-alcohol dehydrogenase-like predicted oxidoreductase